MSRANNEDELIQKARAQNQAAFKALYDHYKGQIYGYAMQELKNPDDAEDVTGEAFKRAWQRIGSFRGDSSFGTWVHSIAHNVILEKWKVDGKTQELIERQQHNLDFATESVEATAVQNIRVQEILQTLDEEDRILLTYRSKEIDYRTIAQELGYSGTQADCGRLKERYHRLRSALRQKHKAH